MSSGKRPKRPRDGRPSSERSGSPPSPKKRTDNPRGTSGSSSKLDVSYLLNDNDNGGTRASTAGHEHSFRAVDVPPPPPLPPPSMAQRASKPSRQGRGGSSSSAPGHSQTRPPPPLPNSQYQSHAVMSSSSPGSSRLPAPPPLPHLHQMQQPQQPLPSYPQPPAARQTHGSGTGGSSNERLHPCSKCDRVFKERGNVSSSMRTPLFASAL